MGFCRSVRRIMSECCASCRRRIVALAVRVDTNAAQVPGIGLDIVTGYGIMCLTLSKEVGS